MAARIIKSMGSNLQTPQDIADLLTQRLRPHFAKHGMEFHCHIIESWRRIGDMFPNVLIGRSIQDERWCGSTALVYVLPPGLFANALAS